MELYTLSSRLLPLEMITNFVSVIWTERYFTAGDVQLVVPPTPTMIQNLTPGTLLGLRGTKEIMMVETQSIENGLLTISGSSLVKYLNQREAWFANPEYGTVLLDDGSVDTTVALSADYSAVTTAGAFVADVITRMAISPTAFTSYWAPINLDWGNEPVPGLSLGLVDGNGDGHTITFPIGQLYDGLESVATGERLGFKLYLASASYTGGFSLKFATYRGSNRTSEQTLSPLIRLSPELDSLTDVKEIVSNTPYKNVVYVSYKNQVTVHYLSYGPPAPTGFPRRVILVEAPNIYLEPDHIPPFLERVAYNTFINNAYIRTVDGRVAKIPYKFTVDYYLGDVIELEGYSGLISKVQVTEYIRSQDRFGAQEYPTLAVIDPLDLGYMPDLEPDPSMDWPWNDDFPDWDLGEPDLTDDEHNPKKRKKKTKKDPNPDPVPVFPTSGPVGPGTGTESAGPTTTDFMVVGYYPDQNKGEAIGMIKFDSETLHLDWAYEGEDPDGDPDNTYYRDLIPMGWTHDYGVIALSNEPKDETDAFPWGEGWAFWRMGGVDMEFHYRLTDTMINQIWVDESSGLSYAHTGYQSPYIGNLWCASAHELKWYLQRKLAYPPEYVYADSTYSTIPDEDPAFHGSRLGSGSAVNLYCSTTGHIADAELILDTSAFPEHMRWSPMLVMPSPDGTKLVIRRQLMTASISSAAGNGNGSQWSLGFVGSAGGGTYKINVATFGSIFGVSTAAIPWNADVATVYNAILLTGLAQDPRLYGYPYLPYYGPSSTYQMVFSAAVEMGIWMAVDDTDLEYGVSPFRYAITNPNFGSYGGESYYLCNADGSDLTEIDFGGNIIDSFGGWSSDSSTIHAIVPTNVIPSSSGNPYTRWLNYDVATGDLSYPLDYSTEIMDSGGNGPLHSIPKYSPDSSKIAWLLTAADGTKSIWVANADGTSKLKLFEQTVDDSSTDQDALVLGYGTRTLVWNSGNTKIGIVDPRDPAPVWVIDISDGTGTKVWAGSGWTVPSEQQWIYDPIDFTAG